MKIRKKKNKIIPLLIMMMVISVGYAALTSNLKINGGSKVTKANWLIYWDNAQVVEESVTNTKPTLSENSTKATYSVTLNEPGDFYEFTIDAVNAGTIDAMIKVNGILNKVYTDSTYEEETTLPKIIGYTITYDDGTEIRERDLLPKKKNNIETRKKYRVRVEYKNDDTINPEDLDSTNDMAYYFRFEVEYVQAEEETSEITKNYICKKATSLHSETCERTDENGCRNNNVYDTGDEIIYGHTDSTKLTNGNLTNGKSAGYALDCDLNGNGIVDLDANGQSTERFYYVSDLYTDTDGIIDHFNSDYAVLIYYKNVGNEALKYYNGKENWHGPTMAFSSLPDRNAWSNEKIKLKTNARTILNVEGTDTTENGNHAIENPFVYENKVARLLTTQEIVNGCNLSETLETKGLLNKCQFLMEDSLYAKESGWQGGSGTYWLETPARSARHTAYSVIGYYVNVDDYPVNTLLAVRPAIEIKKEDISLN